MRKTVLLGMLLAIGMVARGELGVMPEEWQKATNYLVPWTDGKRVFIRSFKGVDLLELKQVCLAYPCIDEAKEVEVTAIADKKAKLRVVNIYGEEQKVEVKNGKATVKANDVPLVIIGCREVVP